MRFSQVEGFAAVRDGLSMVYLEPAARAAGGTAATIPDEHGRTGSLPARGGPDEYAGFTRGATSARSVPLALAARATLPLIGRVDGGAALWA